MTLRDLVAVSTGNLWRMKLRASLTIAGVLIAIGAFVAMVSFGAGNQQNIENEFNKLGLLTTMTAFPKSNDADSTAPPLDLAAVERLNTIPGVNLAYPYDAFAVTVRYGDSTVESKAQALPTAAIRTRLFSGIVAGAVFASDTNRQVIINTELMRALGIQVPDSAIGRKLVVAVHVSTIDSGLAHLVVDKGETVIDRVKRIRLDSLANKAYRTRTLRREANEAVRRFTAGYLNAQREIADTLTIAGVRDMMRAGRLRIEPMFMPVMTAARFTTAGPSGNPVEMFRAMSSGNLFQEPGAATGQSFSQVTIDFDPTVLYSTVRDSVQALGYRTFSFAEQFENLQKVFLYFNLALGVIGLIALFTASLGIVNTMIMSINERRKEIGVLKSLGADDSDIRWLFLVESAVIGLIGTVGGILFGWGITRGVSAVAKVFMRKEGIPEMELFALPVWLILIALAVGVGVSIVAGLYPAIRASRVDPVTALRNE